MQLLRVVNCPEKWVFPLSMNPRYHSVWTQSFLGPPGGGLGCWERGHGAESTPPHLGTRRCAIAIATQGNLQQSKVCNKVLFKQHKRVFQQSSSRQMELLQDTKLPTPCPSPALIFLSTQEAITWLLWAGQPNQSVMVDTSPFPPLWRAGAHQWRNTSWFAHRFYDITHLYWQKWTSHYNPMAATSFVSINDYHKLNNLFLYEAFGRKFIIHSRVVF